MATSANNWNNLFDKLNVIQSAQEVNLGEIQDVLKALVELQKHIIEFLATMSADVKALKDGPFNAGVILLNEAAQPHRIEAKALEDISKARDKFIEAAGISNRSKVQEAIIEKHIAICYLLLGEKRDAARWLDEAFQSALEAIPELEEMKLKTTRFEQIGNAAAAAGAVGGAAAGMVVTAPIGLTAMVVGMGIRLAAEGHKRLIHVPRYEGTSSDLQNLIAELRKMSMDNRT